MKNVAVKRRRTLCTIHLVCFALSWSTQINADEDRERAPRNWPNVSLVQDLLIHGSEPAVCPSFAPGGMAHGGAAEYRCFADETFLAEPVYGPAGNEMKGGLGLASTRLLLGFDRLIGTQWLLGGRVGYAFGGAPTAPGGSSFLPLHLEARAQFYFGDEPFVRASLRPYAVVAGGFAQIASRVPVEVHIDEAGYAAGQSFTVDAWRRGGSGFVSLGLGAALPLGTSALSAEARVAQWLGSSATGLSFGLSYAYGL